MRHPPRECASRRRDLTSTEPSSRIESAGRKKSNHRPHGRPGEIGITSNPPRRRPGRSTPCFAAAVRAIWPHLLGRHRRPRSNRLADGRRCRMRERSRANEGQSRTPVSFSISSRSSITGPRSGMPDLRRIFSASRSGSPGMRTAAAPGTGWVPRIVRM